MRRNTVFEIIHKVQILTMRGVRYDCSTITFMNINRAACNELKRLHEDFIKNKYST
jgi:hypothetical protein